MTQYKVGAPTSAPYCLGLVHSLCLHLPGGRQDKEQDESFVHSPLSENYRTRKQLYSLICQGGEQGDLRRGGPASCHPASEVQVEFRTCFWPRPRTFFTLPSSPQQTASICEVMCFRDVEKKNLASSSKLPYYSARHSVVQNLLNAET